MTREEAAIIIHKLKQDVLTGAVRRYEPLEGEVLLSAEFYDAINMAIENLEQEPCADVISRQAAIDEIINLWADKPFGNPALVEIKDCIEKLSPVTPQYTEAEIQKMQDLEFAEIQKAYEIGKAEGSSENPNKWIPVSERLPEEETDVLVCNVNGDIELSRGSYSTEMKNEFIWYTSGWRFGKVVAWMPLPEPYKASRTGEEVKE